MGKIQRPHEIKLGRIKATIWANETEDHDEWFTTTISRLYKIGDTWKETNSLRRDDLPIAMKAIDMAYGWIWRKHLLVQRAERIAANELLANQGRQS